MSNISHMTNDFVKSKQSHMLKVREIMDSYFPYIPPGDYESTLTDWYTANIKGTSKVVLLFTITEFGEYLETVIPRFYGVKRLTSKPSIKGKFIAKPLGKFAKDYYKMRPDAPRLRRDQIPMTKLQNKLLLITVGTVEKDSEQKKHIEQQKYSVVRDVRII